MNTIDGHVYSHQCQGDECNIKSPHKLTEFWPMSDNYFTLAELLPAVIVSALNFSNVSYIIHWQSWQNTRNSDIPKHKHKTLTQCWINIGSLL